MSVMDKNEKGAWNNWSDFKKAIAGESVVSNVKGQNQVILRIREIQGMGDLVFGK